MVKMFIRKFFYMKIWLVWWWLKYINLWKVHITDISMTKTIYQNSLTFINVSKIYYAFTKLPNSPNFSFRLLLFKQDSVNRQTNNVSLHRYCSQPLCFPILHFIFGHFNFSQPETKKKKTFATTTKSRICGLSNIPHKNTYPISNSLEISLHADLFLWVFLAATKSSPFPRKM